MHYLTTEQWAIVIGGMLIIFAMGIYINWKNRNRW